MKRLLMIFLICFALSINIVSAEKGDEKDNGKLDLAFISVGAGGDPISPGFTASAFFESKTIEIKVKGSSGGMSYVACFLKLRPSKKIPINIEVGPYVGGYCLINENTPSVFNTGGYAKASVGGFLTLFYWKGWGLGNGEEKRGWAEKFIDMKGAYLSIWLIDVGYYHLNLDGEKFHVPSAYFNISINERFMLFVGADYKIRIGEKNKEKESKKFLFKLGLVYNLKK